MIIQLATLISVFLPGGQGRPALGAAVGEPTTGEMGIRISVAELIARDKLRPPKGFNEWRDRKQEHEAKLFKLPNPEAPDVSSWPAPDVRALRSERNDDWKRRFNPQPIGVNFLGASISESGYVPPDTMGAVGPSQVMVAVNGRIKVFDKSGVLGPLNINLDTFFGSVDQGTGTSDPRCRFDRLSNRWFVIGINLNQPNRVMIAVSSGPVITGLGSFTFFQFRFDNTGGGGNADLNGFFDYPSTGIDANAIYIGGNVFNPGFTGTTGFVVRKSSVLGAGPIVVTAFRQLGTNGANGPYSPQGVDNDRAGSTEGYFVGVSTTLFSQLVFRRISTPGGTPTISSNLFLTVPTTVNPQITPCLGSTIGLSAVDDRLFQATLHRNRLTGVETLWTAHNIEVNASGVGNATGNRNGSRFYEIGSLTTTPSLVQSGTLFDSAATNSNNYWMPSIAMSGQGHAALGSSVAGAARRADATTAGRLRTDAPGTIQAPTTIIASATNYNAEGGVPEQRWGDYSMTQVDPNDDMTLWTFQEYCNATNSWGVRVCSLRAPVPATVSSVTPPSQTQGVSNVNLSIVGSSTAGSGWFDPDNSFPNHIAAAFSGAGITVNSVTFTDPTHLTINISVAGSAPTGLRNLTITNPDGQVLTANNAFNVLPGNNPVPTTTSISPNTKVVGSATFDMTVNGTNFIASSVVRFNGSDRVTVFNNATQVTCSIPASDMLAVGSHNITVFNPAPGGGTSNPQNFTVTNPLPTITSISPTSWTTLNGPFTLTVNGTGFVGGASGTVVHWNGNPRTTTFINANQVQANIPGSDVQVGGLIPITAVNPPLGGGTSNAMNCQVKQRRMQGHITLSDFGGDVTAIPVSIEVRNVGSLVSLFSTTVTLNGLSNFSFDLDLAPGNYDITAQASHWLRKLRGSVSATTDIVTGINLSLINGDCDGDNEITLVDVGILSAAFGASTGDPTFDIRADLDGDGEVNLVDGGILAANFGVSGDE